MKMAEKKQKPVILLTGYLGSGKTSVLNELLRQETRRIALIVNDMGKVNVDARLLQEGAKVEQSKMVEMQGGCICCTLRDEFIEQVQRVAESDEVEAVFVEASGISDPSSIAAGFLFAEESKDITSAYLSSVVTVVDADRIYREFLSELESFVQRGPDENGLDENDITNLIVDQVEFCDSILLNKCDLLAREDIEKVKNVIRQIQPKAEIIECMNGKVESSKIITGARFNFDRVHESSAVERALNRDEGEGCTDEYGISSFVFEERRPFDRRKFFDFMEKNYPRELIRAKGYMWFNDNDSEVILFEQAGRNATVTNYAVWIAAMPESADKKELMENYDDEYFVWDEKYGDRMNQIVFIGKGYDESEVRRLLNECLVQYAA
ncbi:MAG: GTP-binding protein [Treponema sp.]|nr:GTP-binding protein [Treponema sp.]